MLNGIQIHSGKSVLCELPTLFGRLLGRQQKGRQRRRRHWAPTVTVAARIASFSTQYDRLSNRTYSDGQGKRAG
jgi:hypothetical protein